MNKEISSWDDYVDKHEYIKGVQCDNENCYACARQKVVCPRLELLDAESSGLI